MNPKMSLEKKIRRSPIKLRLPADEAEIHLFETRAGVSLPGDYRRFITRVGNGGVAPCRLVPVHEWDACYWIDDAPLESSFRRGCIVTPAAEQHGRDWIDLQNVRSWQERVDRNEWDPMLGTIAVAEIGCGLFYSLIVTGPHRGRVFSYGDHIGNPPRFVKEPTFGTWIEGCVDRVLAGERVDFLDG